MNEPLGDVGERLRERRLLARAGFGPRPGDAEALRARGSEAWLGLFG